MLSLQKQFCNNFFFCIFFQFPTFHSKIHKSCGAFLRGGGGNSLKLTNIEGEWAGGLGYM